MSSQRSVGADKLEMQPKQYDQASINGMIGKLNRLLSQLNGAIGAGPSMLVGHGPPGVSTPGSIGDCYYDYTNQAFYGPLTSSGWGSAHTIG